MGLLVCEDCRHEVSDAAESCPECGRPMSGRGADRFWTFELAGVLSLFGVGSMAYSLIFAEPMVVDEARVKFWFGFQLIGLAFALVALGWWRHARGTRTSADA